MTHYICTGGCGGVSEKEGTCQAITCPKHGVPLEACDCTDGKHYGKQDRDAIEQGGANNSVGVNRGHGFRLGRKSLIAALIVVFSIAYVVLIGGAPTHRVIVGISIDPPYQSDPILSPEKQEAQRAAIQKGVDEVLSDLYFGSYVGVKRFKYIPFFAVRINDAARARLSKNPLVISVEEDRLSSATVMAQ